jgi:hypothetical protein
MQRGDLDDLAAFVAVSREGSFTKAAAADMGLKAKRRASLLWQAQRSPLPFSRKDS